MTRLSKKSLRRLAATVQQQGTAADFVPDKPVFKRNEESEMQRALIRWWDTEGHHQFNLPKNLLFSIPNGNNGDAKRGSIMKAEGQRKGAPDLMLAKPKYRVESWKWDHGLFLELKTATGRLMPEQEEFHFTLRNAGYRVEVVRSLAEAQKIITEYLS